MKCLNTRKLLNCIFRSKVMWSLQIMLNYRSCFRNMNLEATKHLQSTGTEGSHGEIYSERLCNINMHICLTIHENNNYQNTRSVFCQKSDTITKTLLLHFVLHCISSTLSCTSQWGIRVPPPWDQMHKFYVHVITQMDALFKMQ